MSGRWIGLILLVLFAGCATEANLQARMNGLVGKSESDLVARLGAPQHVDVLQDGSRILVYTQMETTQQGAPYQAPPARLTGGIYGGNSGVMYTPSASYSRPQGLASAEMVSCTIAFRILGDRIESWRSRGDNCVSN
jgi:hypothetical protein